MGKYDDAAWRRVRRVVLERDGYVCQIRGPKCTVDATEVDHIIPWRVGGAYYDEDNLRAACSNDNKRRAWRESVGARKPVRPSRDW